MDLNFKKQFTRNYIFDFQNSIFSAKRIVINVCQYSPLRTVEFTKYKEKKARDVNPIRRIMVQTLEATCLFYSGADGNFLITSI